MSEFESRIESNNDIINDQDFLSLAIDYLEDSRLNQEEREILNEKISDFNIEKQSLEEETTNSLIEIRNEIDLKNIIKESLDFEKVKEQMSNLSRQEIKNIQYITGGYVDGIFGINTYLKYKNAPISDVFSPEQISKGRKVGENMSLFIDNFSRLNGVDTELMAIAMSSDISRDSFVFVDEKGNITIMDKGNDNNIITFSEKMSVEGLLHESFIKKDINLIINQLKLLYRKQDRIEYISKLRNIILEYGYQKEARKIFTNKTSRGLEIKLPELNLNKEMKAVDLFGDYNELIIDGEKYTNNSNGEFYSETGKRLSIYNGMVLNIEEYNQQIEQTPGEVKGINLYENLDTRPKMRPQRDEEIIDSSIRPRKRPDSITQNEQLDQNEQINENIESNLSKEFGDWLRNEGEKHLGRTGPNSCGIAVYKLIDTFMRSRSIRSSLNIGYQRHGANFDSILTGEISDSNPFILQWGNNTSKISNSLELKNSGLDINNIINDSIQIKIRSIDFPKEAREGEILVYNEDADSQRATSARRKYGHVEIKGSDNNYYSYYKSNIPGGSAKENENMPAEEYARLTGFNGKAYSIELKT